MEKTERAIKNEPSRETGSIENKTQNEYKKNKKNTTQKIKNKPHGPTKKLGGESSCSRRVSCSCFLKDSIYLWLYNGMIILSIISTQWCTCIYMYVSKYRTSSKLSILMSFELEAWYLKDSKFSLTDNSDHFVFWIC